MTASVTSNRRPSLPHKSSSRLTDEENKILFSLVGNRVMVQAAAVVQVYGTEAPKHVSWCRKHFGIATFSKDNNRRSYYIQVYDIVRRERIFEQEIYQNFSYHASLPFFHQFEGDQCIIGLSFADENEARFFNSTVQDRLNAKLRKREERRRISDQQQHQQKQQNVMLKPRQNNSIPSHQIKQETIKYGGRKNKRNHKFSAADIGKPQDFRHITHVGFDPDNGLTTEGNHDEHMQTIFNLIGVDVDKADPQTQRFIYDFIEKNGGMEKVKEESQLYSGLNNRHSRTASNNNNTITHASDKPPPPPPPSQMPPTVPSLPSRNAPPPPPPRTAQPQHVNSMPTPAPPPPSAKNALPSRGPPPIPGYNKSAAPPPPPSGGRQPPPPPPPQMAKPGGGGGPPPPPAPPPMASAPSGGDDRSMLLNQIRGGIALKDGSHSSSCDQKVEDKDRSAAPADSRSMLLDAIRQGAKLKPVDVDRDSCGSGSDTTPTMQGVELSGMVGALALALQNRAKVIQSDDSEEESDVSDEEWDED